MQKIWYWTKRIVVFLVSSLVISWLMAYLFFALISHFYDLNDISDIELLKMTENKEDMFFDSFFADALIAFLIMYVMGLPLLKSYNFKTAKFVTLCVVTYLLLFLLLVFFA